MDFFRFGRKGAMAATAISVLATLGGCLDETYVAQDRTDRTPRELHLTHQAGGAHHCGLIHDGVWYVSQGSTLLSVDPRTGKVRNEELIAPEGTSGAIVDMVIWRGDLLVVLNETAVARIDLQSTNRPVTVELIDADKLGVHPTKLSIIGDTLFVSGRGGVVELPSMRRSLKGEERVGSVAPSENGPVAVVDRRVVTVADGSFVGAATYIGSLPSSSEVADGLVFVLQSREGASIGLMGPDVREVATGAVAGLVNRVRVIGSRLWVITENELVCWDISKGTLGVPEIYKVKGARDVDAINDNYLAVVGSFGRAVLRLRDDSTGSGDEFLRVTRVPGRLDLALSDQRTTVGSSVEGNWIYPVRGVPSLSDRKVNIWTIPARSVTAVWGSAKLVGDEGASSKVEISGGIGGAKGEWSPADNGRVWVLTVVDGDLWIGHDHGITVLRHRDVATMGGPYPVAVSAPKGKTTPECPLVEIGSVTWEGPIFNLTPLRTGKGVSFVSRWGGFGVVEWVIPSEKPRSPAAASRVSARTDTPRRTIDDR